MPSRQDGELAAVSDVAERARRRVARRILPFLSLVYIVAYIDRANLGIAKLQMQRDLGFSDATIGLGAGIFFLGYVLLEIPGTLIVERWSARKWLARIMISWGIAACLMAFLGTRLFGGAALVKQFYWLRFLLGVAEAGFFPGVIVYLSHWFRVEDRAFAKAWFMIAQPLAIAIGLPVSRWIVENVHWAGWAGWRWVFLIEGGPAIILGVVTLLYLTDRPHQAEWMPDDEKRWLAAELSREEAGKVAAGRVRFWLAFRDPSTLLLGTVFFLIVTGNQAMIYFLPSITENMKGMSVTVKTLVTMTPYLLSVCGILWNGLSSRRTGERRWHTALPILLTATAWFCAILAGDRVALAITFFGLAGFVGQAYLPVFWTLPTGFLGKDAAAASVGIINSLGNLGGFVGPYLFGYLRTSTGSFTAGLWFLAGCMFCAGLLATRIQAPRSPIPNSKRMTHAAKA
ncbi:MAG: MFS transporter [Candidatus Solibacter sp.]